MKRDGGDHVQCLGGDPQFSRRIVLTGGPGAGKTAVLELIRRAFCRHVRVLPEAASIVFGGGFPREPELASRQAAQRAIFHVQRQLEELRGPEGRPGISLCDRGTLDGLAYWPDSGDDMLAQVGSSQASELERYWAVIHLRTPSIEDGYNHSNALRTESAAAAALIDARIAEVWKEHPRRIFVQSQPDFLAKAKEALRCLRLELPPCCRTHTVPKLDALGGAAG